MDTNITLLIMTNGRKAYMEEMLKSLDKLHGNITKTIIHDDSGNPEFREWLNTLGHEVVTTEKVGFTKAMISAWNRIKNDDNPWVFHMEEDFLILEDINLNDILEVMEARPYLKQIVLSRAPIWKRRVKKRGVVISAMERFKDTTDGKNNWVENRINFSCNPSLYRRSLVSEFPWPDAERSEHTYSAILLGSNPDFKVAYWGKTMDQPRVEHIGKKRTGFNY